MEDRIDPWSSSTSTDYEAIITRFGLDRMPLGRLRNPHRLHRRGIIFAQRDLDPILEAQQRGEPHGVLTGLMPSGRMHLGHSMVVDQVKWFQEHGADVTIAVADLESVATRGIDLQQARRTALEEYVASYAALGLDPERTSVYFQSRRSVVQRLGFTLGMRTNLSELEAIYGFDGSTNLAHVQAPLVQAGDILHPQLEEHGGLRPIVVPVGTDQDPHLRLTRGLASKTSWFNLTEPKQGGMLIGLSVQDSNARALGVGPNGRIDRTRRQSVIDAVLDAMTDLGFADKVPNPKHGTVHLLSATGADRWRIRSRLLHLERHLGGPGLMPPSSTYHRFAVGLDGGKMSSSNPKSTLFLTDDATTIERKIKRAYSGGQPTVEEHRRLGGDVDRDVPFQYLSYFFEEDDRALADLAEAYRNGRLLAGEMKQVCIEAAHAWFQDHQEHRDQTAHLIPEFLAEDSR